MVKVIDEDTKKEIVRLKGLNYSNEKIAERLGLHRNTVAKILKELTEKNETIKSENSKGNLFPFSKYESLRESLENQVLMIRELYDEDEDFRTAMNDEGFFYLNDDAYVFLRSVDSILHDNHLSYDDLLKAIKTTIYIKNLGLTLDDIIKLAKAKVNVRDLTREAEDLKTELHTLKTLISSDSTKLENLEKMIEDKKGELVDIGVKLERKKDEKDREIQAKEQKIHELEEELKRLESSKNDKKEEIYKSVADEIFPLIENYKNDTKKFLEYIIGHDFNFNNSNDFMVAMLLVSKYNLNLDEIYKIQRETSWQRNLGIIALIESYKKKKQS